MNIEFNVIAYLNDGTIKEVKDSIYEGSKRRSKENSYIDINFFDWKKRDNDFALCIGYVHKIEEEVELPIKLNRIIFKDKGEEFPVDITIKYAVFNGFMPVKTIEKAHKYICICSFKGEIPNILRYIP